MFSFHKPKTYRSLNGCCICRAKSSSSRFTDSKKYEAEFEKCFRVVEKRSGEICNACVLLVKRWKKLPTGTDRDWHHVVDARAGPGTKSFKNKHGAAQREKKVKKNNGSNSEEDEEFDEDEDILDEDEDDVGSVDDSNECADYGEESANSLRRSSRLTREHTTGTVSRRSRTSASRKSKPHKLSQEKHVDISFIDSQFWTKEVVCCGIIYRSENKYGTLMMMVPSIHQPCRHRIRDKQSKQQQQPNEQHKSTNEPTVGEVITVVKNVQFPVPKRVLQHQDSFATSSSNDSLLSDNANVMDENDDRSSGISSMAVGETDCDDHLSTVSSNLMDVDDGNSSNASDMTFDHHLMEMSGAGVGAGGAGAQAVV